MMRSDYMQVQDRGTKKWVSLMLPEHVDMLKEVFLEYKEKPVLDEQQMIEIDQKLKFALETDEVIEMTYYERGMFKKTNGRLEKVDQSCGYIMLLNEHGQQIPLGDIIDVEILY